MNTNRTKPEAYSSFGERIILAKTFDEAYTLSLSNKGRLVMYPGAAIKFVDRIDVERSRGAIDD